MAEKVTFMKLEVDLECQKCFNKVKKVLAKYPQIQDQKFNHKGNIVFITVVCCSPEKIRDKLCTKGGGSIKSIEILEQPKPAEPEKKKDAEKPKPAEPEKKKEPEKPKEKLKEAEKPKPAEPEKKKDGGDKPKDVSKPKGEPEKPKDKPAEAKAAPPPVKLPDPVPTPSGAATGGGSSWDVRWAVQCGRALHQWVCRAPGLL